MNIKEAKNQIKNTIQAYFSKDEYGSLLIPLINQRPIIIMGAPGVGKTAIIAQIARELNIALVSYSMTHHTRQSVLGLPVINEKEYGKVSEYTMSEIIAEIYKTQDKTHLDKGILFLDEINCVSETLMPTMLQFLQYKKLGQHQIPDNWLIIAAGNPNEYNKNAYDFDVVTWDRLKRIDVEPEYQVWKEYESSKGAHGSIISYLDIKKDNFYRFETTVDGNKFITTRSWDDLSEAIDAYERLNIEIDQNLINQYLQYPEIALDFYHYYCLYKKYEADYQIDTILDGSYSKIILQRAKNASFDERYSLINLILTALIKEIKLMNEDEDYIRHLLSVLKLIKEGKDASNLIIQENEKRDRELKMGLLTKSKNKEYERVISFVSDRLNENFDNIKTDYNKTLEVINDNANAIIKRFDNIFDFVIHAFDQKDELSILVTELTVNYYIAHFISRHSIDSYNKYASLLSINERNIKLKEEINQLNTNIEI